jgi:hypothetical protein
VDRDCGLFEDSSRISIRLIVLPTPYKQLSMIFASLMHSTIINVNIFTLAFLSTAQISARKNLKHGQISLNLMQTDALWAA